MKHLLLLAACGVLSGCPEVHGRVPGIDPDRPLISLSEEEWQRFCDWREALRAPEPLEYHCVYPEREPVDLCDRPGMTPCFDWRARTCMGRNIRVIRPIYPPTRTNCSVTVEEFAACEEDREALVCSYYVAGESPACDVVRERCPDPT